MRIRNNRKKANFVNFKVDGFAKKVMIPAEKEVEVKDLLSEAQILNKRDFNLGFFEIVAVEKPKLEEKKSGKVEDTLDKVKKQVLDYTSESKKKKKSN